MKILWPGLRPKDWPLQPGFWAEIGREAEAVFQAARLLDLPVDDELEQRCAGLAEQDGHAFAELALPVDPPRMSPGRMPPCIRAFRLSLIVWPRKFSIFFRR